MKERKNKNKEKFHSNDFETFWIWMSYHNELVKLSKVINFNTDSEENRSFVRSLMSMVEGISYRTRRNLLSKQATGGIELSPQEIIVLSDQIPVLTQNGEIKLQDKFYGFEQMFKFTFKTYATKMGKLDFYYQELSKDGYKKLNNTVGVRNRITHPKKSIDVHVTGPEVKEADIAHEWFHKFNLNLFIGDTIEVKDKTDILLGGTAKVGE